LGWQVFPAVLHAVQLADVLGSTQEVDPPLLDPEPEDEPEPDEL